MTTGLATPTIDRVAALVAAFGFSVGLGVATVTIPLLALAAGYDAATVGFLVATSAVSQLATRLALPWMLRRLPDRTLIAISSVLMLAAFGLLLVSTVLVAFATAQLLQGAARAIFWTSSQTHVVRSGGNPVERLVDLNMVGNAGTLLGPAVAGMLAAVALSMALAAAAIGAIVAIAFSPFLARLAPADRRGSVGAARLITRDGVDIACWSSVVGGGWWSMIGSYIPIILVGAGIAPQGIGWLITASEGASIAVLVALRRLPVGRIRAVVRFGAAGCALALIAIALVPPEVPAYLLVLLAGGAASGAVTALGPAVASLASGPDEQGDAMALTGTFRAAALLGSPLAVGALLSVVALAPAVVIAGAVLGLPGLVVGRQAAGRVSPSVRSGR